MPVCLYTDLSVDECLQRLGASGWAGEAKPQVEQPTALDHDIFRTIHGRQFHLGTQAGGFPPLRINRWLVYAFYGQLELQGRGTRITGYYGVSPAEKRRFAVTFVLCIIGTFILILNVSHSRYGNTDLSLELVLSYGVLMACTLIFLMTDISTKSRRRKVDRFEDYFARFLARLLDARPLEAGRPGAERGRPQPPS